MNNPPIHRMLYSHSKNPFLSPVFLSFRPTPEIILDAFFIPTVCAFFIPTVFAFFIPTLPSTSKYTHSIYIQYVIVSFYYLLPPPVSPASHRVYMKLLFTFYIIEILKKMKKIKKKEILRNFLRNHRRKYAFTKQSNRNCSPYSSSWKGLSS